MLPPLKPIAMKERISLIFIERGEIDVLDGAFVVIDKNGVRTHIPVGSVACIMLEPGTRVSHRAAALAARVGTLLVWVGEAGVRVYASGQPGGARSGSFGNRIRIPPANTPDTRRLRILSPDSLRIAVPVIARWMSPPPSLPICISSSGGPLRRHSCQL